jgi:hypothetical protein
VLIFHELQTVLAFAFLFKTTSPAANCEGSMFLIPQTSPQHGGVAEWKIWNLRTWIEDFEDFPEDVSCLSLPGRDLSASTLKADVFILGGGNT